MKKSLTISALLLCCNSTLGAEARLEEVFVTASRIEQPWSQVSSSVLLLDRQALDRYGYPSLAEVLRTQAGIGVSNSGGAGKATSLRIRGEEAYRTVFFVDGMDISDPTGTQASAQIQHLLVTGDIERVEVLKGPQGFSYGADAGGVVNVLTQRLSQGLAYAARAETGRYQSRVFSHYLAAGNALGDVLISHSDQRTDGFNARADAVSDDEDGYDNTTWHAKLGWNLHPRWRAQLVARDVDADNAFDACSFTDTNGAFVNTDDCWGNYSQQALRASLSYQSDALLSEFAWSRSDLERENFANQIPGFAIEGRMDQVEYLATITELWGVRWVLGGDFERHEVQSPGEDKRRRDQHGVFAEAIAQPLEPLSLSVGLRHDDNDDSGEHRSVRVASAYVQPLNSEANLKYRASFGSGFRAPSLFEIAYNAGPFAFGAAADTVLTEEQSEGFDLGVEYRHDSGLQLELNYFHQRIEDEIFFDLLAFSGYLQADGSSRSKGIEFSYQWPLSTQVQLRGNYTINQTRDRDDTVRPRRPEKLANIGAQWSLWASRLQFALNLRFSRDAKETDGTTLDDYHVMDINANYQVADPLTLFVRVENAGDRSYREVRNFNTAGAAVYAGLRLAL